MKIKLFVLSESTTALGSLRVSARVNMWLPWKKQLKPFSPDKLVIPLPIPHPAHIAITIHNRDSDDPIPLESETCQNILRGIEESHTSPDDNGRFFIFFTCYLNYSFIVGVNRYRGGGDTFETASSSSETMDSVENGLDEAKQQTNQSNCTSTDGVYQWTLRDWGQRKRNNSGSVRVDLASPEDVTLDSDSTRVVFSTYGTTV